MRSHHKQPRPLGRPEDGEPPQPPLGTTWGAIAAAPLDRSYTLADQILCPTCGATILAGETCYTCWIGPDHILEICYNCGVAILINRRELDPSKDPMPPTHTGYSPIPRESVS